MGSQFECDSIPQSIRPYLSETMYGSRDQPLILDAYEPIEEDEPRRPRSASPRLETEAFAPDGENIEPRQYESPQIMPQNPEFFKPTRFRASFDVNTPWPRSAPLNNRRNGRRAVDDDIDKAALIRRDRASPSSQPKIRDGSCLDKQSIFEDWKYAGDRIFCRPSKSRQ